jgi:membrane protein DedA with SNARE-associated domain/cytochrome b561
MTELANSFLAWTEAHPGAALWILFFAAALDAVFLIGALVPAGPVLFTIGALVALDVLPFWPVVFIAAAGALAGDSFSFWLGRRYGEHLFQSRWMQRRQTVVDGARQFFDRHGGKGVLIGRFLGPLRAVLATVAGASGMRLWLFLAVDSVAVLLWSFAFILPGVAFGASLGLAAEVAGRLALLLALLAALVWGIFYLTRLVLIGASERAERWIGRMLDWSRRYRRLRRFGAALADPQQPETPVLAGLAVLLWGLGALLLFLVAAPVFHTYPWPSDAAVYQSLNELHTPYGIALARVLLLLGEWPVYAPVAAAMAISLTLQRKGRALAHWIAALAFGAGLSIGLSLVPTLPSPAAYFGHALPAGHSERDLVLAVVIYAFIPILLTTRRPTAWRSACYGSAATLIALIILGRLYLGAQWWSQVLIELGIGLLWAALLGLGYRRPRPAQPRPPVTALPVMASLLIATALFAPRGEAPPVPLLSDGDAGRLSFADWQDEGYRQFPAQRFDVAGRPKQPLNLQWAGRLEDIAAVLETQGWEAPPPLASEGMLRWLSAQTPIEQLPVLPHIHAGDRQRLLLRQGIDSGQQRLLRLWPTGTQLDDGRPLWVGNLMLQEAREAYSGLMRYPIALRPLSPLEILAGVEVAYRADRSIYLLSTPRPSGDD